MPYLPFRRLFVGVLVAALSGLSACGARTDLEEQPAPLDLPDGQVPECTEQLECEDGVSCTDDRCEAGRCVQRIDAQMCETSSLCQIGRCDPSTGCVSTPINCDDGVSCTVDTCADPFGCAHEPDPSLCPISHRCDPTRGCVAQALIHNSEALYQVDLPSGDFTLLARLPARLTDIALASDRSLYGVSFNWIFEVDEELGETRPIFPSPGDLVALDVGPGGILYGAGKDERIIAIDLSTGSADVVALLPAGWVASGDIAFVDGRMLVTVTDVPSSEVGSDQLAEIDLGQGTARLLGATGFPCIWAVAAFGPTLYGFTCHGDLLRIDPFSGATERLRGLSLRVGGAAAR